VLLFLFELEFPGLDHNHASAAANYFGPWIISVSLPVGAAVFLSRRKKLVMAPAVAPAA
jgi:hypothetical protein